ncbi:hypothetical protein [Ruegeria arenilitoris]|uniref:hypothetical protein n=1 Tax=Ruegeria arenilitoris TaxID=1173585 RepID=UPI00147EF4B2|nr:hypothetical protein [Ruegeria arenilitoris]
MADEDQNSTQAEALIAAIAPKIAEAIIPQLAEQVETQIKGVVAKNDELLDKLQNMKKDAEIAESAKNLQAITDAATRVMNGPQGNNTQRNFQPHEPIRLSRSDARDVRKYREARAQAEKVGVVLEIVAEE